MGALRFSLALGLIAAVGAFTQPTSHAVRTRHPKHTTTKDESNVYVTKRILGEIPTLADEKALQMQDQIEN